MALTPLPPLGFAIKALVLSRLLGDPIGTLQDLLLKMSDCQTTRQEWLRYFDEDPALAAVTSLPSYYRWENARLRKGIQSPSRAASQLQSRLLHDPELRFRKREKLAKGFALIAVSYSKSDYGLGEQVTAAIRRVLHVGSHG